MRLAHDAIAYWPLRSDPSSVCRQYFGYAKGDALGGMYPERHAIRFSVYAGAIVAVSVFPRRRWPAAAAGAGAMVYASRRLRRAMHLLPGGLDRAKAMVVVPALLGLIDAAKMAGYATGWWERAYRASTSPS